MVIERLCKLKEAMKKAGIDYYLIPTSDDHDSEYVSEYFMVRRYFSGFTGSAGTLVVGCRETVLFTDARYFIQAQKELEESGIRLMRQGEEGVPSILGYLQQSIAEGQTLGFDGRLVRADQALDYETLVREKGGELVWNLDLADSIWTDRPPLAHRDIFLLPERYSGESAAAKLSRVREKMEMEGAQVHIITVLDDIAWLFNIRGNDVHDCPLALSYALITHGDAILFVEQEAVSDQVKEYLEKSGVRLLPYEDFYRYVSGLKDKSVLLCGKRISYRLKKELGESITVIDRPNPSALMKAIKNSTEMENLRTAHLKDGIAVTRFMYWLKKNVGKLPMTEMSAAAYLEKQRKEMEHFIEPSFDTICAYGSNGAIIHYTAREKDCASLEPQGLLVVDSGGHYLEGSTDITRTYVLGEITQEMKEHYTLVLKAMLNLRGTRFLYGYCGSNLDIRARGVLWEYGLDYKHGTGHGVGYLMNVHEGPNSFRVSNSLNRQPDTVLQEGMVTTDEPGIYIEGSHGVRIEDELLCRKGEKNEYGQFMYFEDLTCAPIDLEGIESSMLTGWERKQLNEYHSQVFERLSPHFKGEELNWLREATREI